MAPSRPRLALALTSAVLAISSAAVVIRGLGQIDPLLVAGGRVAITALALSVVDPRGVVALIATCRRTRGLGWKLLAAASLLALHFGTWIASLGLTTVLRSVVLVSTQPLFAALLARWTGERASARLWLGGLVALAGVGLLVAPEELLGMRESQPTEVGKPSRLVGDALALVGAATAAGYLAIGRSLKNALPLRPYLASIHAIAAVQLVGLALVLGTEAPDSTGPAGLWLAAGVLYLGLVPGIVGHGLINWAVRHVPVHAVTLATLLEPLGAGLLAWIALGEAISPWSGLGAIVLLTGVGLGLELPASRRSPPEPR